MRFMTLKKIFKINKKSLIMGMLILTFKSVPSFGASDCSTFLNQTKLKFSSLSNRLNTQYGNSISYSDQASILSETVSTLSNLKNIQDCDFFEQIEMDRYKQFLISKVRKNFGQGGGVDKPGYAYSRFKKMKEGGGVDKPGRVALSDLDQSEKPISAARPNDKNSGIGRPPMVSTDLDFFNSEILGVSFLNSLNVFGLNELFKEIEGDKNAPWYEKLFQSINSPDRIYAKGLTLSLPFLRGKASTDIVFYNPNPKLLEKDIRFCDGLYAARSRMTFEDWKKGNPDLVKPLQSFVENRGVQYPFHTLEVANAKLGILVSLFKQEYEDSFKKAYPGLPSSLSMQQLLVLNHLKFGVDPNTARDNDIKKRDGLTTIISETSHEIRSFYHSVIWMSEANCGGLVPKDLQLNSFANKK